MKNTLASIVLILALAFAVSASTITFDDIVTTQPWTTLNGTVQNAWVDVPASYAGFEWVGWEVINFPAYNTLYGQSEPYTGNFAYSGNDSAELSMSSDSPFYFMGAKVSGWPNAVGAVNSVTIAGYLGGNFVASLSLGLPNYWQPTGYFQDSEGDPVLIDKLVFTPVNGYFRLDNIQYGVPDGGSDVPEPATMLLTGGGLLALGLIVRKRRRS